MRYRGLLYRALNPVHAQQPLSGRGAQIYGGRFYAKGTPALYLSVTIGTALREANQAGSLQPTTRVSYDAEIERVFDGRDGTALAAAGTTVEGLGDPTWRDQMRAGDVAGTQAFAARIAAAGHDGLLVRSYAPGTGPDDLNLVLWRWGPAPPSRPSLIDDEGRL